MYNLTENEERELIALVLQKETARETAKTFFLENGFKLIEAKKLFSSEARGLYFISAFLKEEDKFKILYHQDISELITLQSEPVQGDDMSCKRKAQTYLRYAFANMLSQEDPDSLKEWLQNVKKANATLAYSSLEKVS